MALEAQSQTMAGSYEAPPRLEIGALGWVKKNLFGSWFDSILTLIALAFLVATLVPFSRWAFQEANWLAITTNIEILMHGPYPQDQNIRVLYAALILVGLGVLSAFIYRLPFRVLRQLLTISWVLSPLPIWIILQGFAGSEILPLIEPSKWGGLLLTILLTLIGIGASFPLGVLLALGRRSDLPIIRWLCTLYIEVVRGSPLITILFMAQVLLPIFLPSDIRIPGIYRAMVGFTMFSAAYLAENVRGGLQAIPKGQREAAQALGLNTFQEIYLITLPQALRIVIPPLVNQFTGMFKDTTLVAIVGLLDILFIGKSILSQAGFLGAQKEVYLFISLIFFILCYLLSVFSSRLETSLGVGER